MSTSFPSTGMITTSPTNPLDEIPIGPQTFPFGTPSAEKSHVEPYLATSYKNDNSKTIINSTQVYPATNYQNVSTNSNKYQVHEEYPVTNYQTSTIKQEYTDTAVYPATNYKKVTTSKYEEIPKETYYLGETIKYKTTSTPLLTTSYQTITSYKPVVKTILVPRITTTYIQNPYGNLVETRVINPPIPTPEPNAQRPLYSPETVPLPAPVMAAPFVPLGKPPAPKPAPTITPMQIQVQDDSHYISNYPIYETDPRRSEYYIKRNQSILNSMNLGSQVITSHYPSNSITGNILGTDLGINNGISTGLNNGMNTYYNTGLSEVNTGINTINLNGLNTGVNNLGTDINTNGTNYLNSAGNVTSTTDNIASGLNNFSNQVEDFATNAVNNTEEGLNNITSEVKGLFD